MLSALAFLISWGNAPFAIAVGVAAVFALLQVTGVLGLIAGGGGEDHDADVDHDVDADVDHDLDHDADHEVDADHDHDVDHDQDHDADDDAQGHDRSWAVAALAPLGFGRIPFSMIWQTFALAFAATGIAMNLGYLGIAGGPPFYTLVWTCPVAMVAGYGAVAAVAKLLGPVLSSKEQEATSRAQLVGQMGVVISSKVDKEFGEVRIRDKSGHDIRVVCKLAEGAKRVPTEKQNVLVVDYQEDKGELLVEPLEDEDLTGGEARRRVS